MDRALEILGIGRCGLASSTRVYPRAISASVPEGCFAQIEISDAAAPLVEVIRSFRPHVMTTYDERTAGTRIPTKVMCHKIGVAAFDCGVRPRCVPRPWSCLATAQALLLVCLLSPTDGGTDRAMVAQGLESPYTERLRDWPEGSAARGAGSLPGLPVPSYFHVRPGPPRPRDPGRSRRAVVCSATSRCTSQPGQDRRNGIGRSLVDTTIPEDDLFGERGTCGE